jgi:selenocysteine lyase/cysteine desulfurase
MRAAAGLAAPPPSQEIDWSKVRADFPWLKDKVWLTAADYHPLSIHSLRAAERYLHWKTYGPGPDRDRFTAGQQRETKELFARLIGAQPQEIAFVSSTTDAENLVVAGLGLADGKGNVVIDSLHYQATKYLYRMLQKEAGLELRIVRHRPREPWTIDPADMEKAIDRNTRLVSVALVSNINGYLHDIRRTAEVAHARGALVYADIIQGAGAIPIDVRAMGIDCAGCGAYKWLMGDMGFGFLYVREDLHERIRRTRYGVRQYASINAAQTDSGFRLLSGGARYELAGSLPNCAGVVSHAALQYIHKLGIDKIRAHAKPLTDRLQRELPRMGYPAITPPDNPTAIVSFLTPRYRETGAKIQKAFGESVIAMRRWEFSEPSGEVKILEGMRISPSVYNNQQDIDRLLDALS